MQGDESREARLDDLLRALPPRELDPRVDARVLRRAQAVLAEEPRGGLAHGLLWLWQRAIAPALLTGTVASYLVWAVASTNALYR
jgi:hypothetical protein